MMRFKLDFRAKKIPERNRSIESNEWDSIIHCINFSPCRQQHLRIHITLHFFTSTIVSRRCLLLPHGSLHQATHSYCCIIAPIMTLQRQLPVLLVSVPIFSFKTRPPEPSTSSSALSAASSSIAGNSTVMMNGNKGEGETVYTVLYYKSKNKVHKSKGVSKMDGTLAIQETKSLVVLKADDGDSVVWQGTFNAELAQKEASQELLDKVISIGPYEVEILSVVGNANTSALATTVKQTVYKRPIHELGGPLRSTSGTMRKNLAGKRPPSLVSTNTSISGSRSKSSLLPSIKRSRLQGRKLPPQPKKAKPFDEDDEEDPTSVSSGSTTSSIKKTTFSVPRLSRKALPSFQPPTKIASTPSASNTAALPLVTVDGRNRARPTTTIGGSTATTTTVARGSNAFAAEAVKGNSFFPGAIGNLTVPHCIKQVLRPHQVEGVTFLWNCLTGNGKVAEVSPHCYPSEKEDEKPTITYKGCILGDGEFWVMVSFG